MILQKISKRESIVTGLFQKISALENESIKVYRDLDKPERIGIGGVIVIRDNEAAKEVDVLLSPLTYTYELTLKLEVIVQHSDSGIRNQMLDLLLLDIENLISKERTLEGLVEWVEVKPHEFEDEPIEGAATVRSAIMPVVVRFSGSDSFQ